MTQDHPDFLWALPRDYRPQSVGDRASEYYEWDALQIPDNLMPLIVTSSRQAQPLFRVIDFIYQQSLEP